MDEFNTSLAGHVLIRRAGVPVFDGWNVVTDTAIEVILRSLLASDSIKNVVFAYTGGLVPSPTTKALPGILAVSPVATTGELQPDSFKDLSGVRSVGRWQTSYTPAADLTYDALGLVSSAGLLVAAIGLQPTTFAAGEPQIVEWTLALRGVGSYWPAA